MKWRGAIVVLGVFTLISACADSSEIGTGGEAMESGWDPQFTEDWGPKVGTKLPDLHARDTSGKVTGLKDLVGEKGVLLFFVRSTNW